MLRHAIIASLAAICFTAYGADAPKDSTPGNPGPASLKTVTAGKFVLSYKIDSSKLVAMVSYPDSGWVAVGFGAKSVMKNAHIIMGDIINGKPVVIESYGTGMFSHKPLNEIKGTATLIAGDCVYAHKETTLSFTIPLDNKGNKFAPLAPGQQIKVIFAHAQGADLTKKHSDKTSAKITL